MSRTALILAALALATSFGIGRATTPEPAGAGVSDATLAEVVAQLRITNQTLGGYTSIPGRPPVVRSLQTMTRQLKATCDNIRSLNERSFVSCPSN